MQKKLNALKVIQAHVFLLFWAIMLCAFVFVVGMQLSVYETHDKTSKAILADIAKEKAKAQSLDLELIYKGGDKYIERIAREELGYIRHDEIIFYRKGVEQ